MLTKPLNKPPTHPNFSCMSPSSHSCILQPVSTTNTAPQMAVETQHHHFCPSQLVGNREITRPIEHQADTYNNEIGFFNPLYSTVITTNAFTDTVVGSLPTKRSRNFDLPGSFFGNGISSDCQQHQLEIDWLIARHVDEVELQLVEQRKNFMKQMMKKMEEKAARWLKAKEEETERMTKLNLALEERVIGLCRENKIWQEIAQANEAAVKILQSKLEQLLVSAQDKVKEESHEVLEDAESCCGKEDESMRTTELRLCKKCHNRESTVLLLPCRHLCICHACSPEISFCPVCNCKKIGHINVNWS